MSDKNKKIAKNDHDQQCPVCSHWIKCAQNFRSNEAHCPKCGNIWENINEIWHWLDKRPVNYLVVKEFE